MHRAGRAFGGQQQNFDVKSLLPDTMFQDEAVPRVTLGLIVGQIVKSGDKSLALELEEKGYTDIIEAAA